MTHSPSEFPSLMFSLVKKAFSFESGALLVLSAAPSYTLTQFMELVLRNTDMRDLFVPLVIFTLLLGVYILVSAVDFYTGTSASKKEHIISTGSPRGYIKSDKLWSSIWKFLGVLLIASILTIFTLIFAVLDKDTFYSMFLYGMVFFYLVVVMFDLHSIGENQFRRFGSKPKIYNFIDEASEVIKKGFIRKIGKYFE